MFAAKRGVDLTAFTMLPFGGAGAVHSAAIADELGMRRILVPPRPGAFSALGLICTDVVHDYIRCELKPLVDDSGVRELTTERPNRAKRRRAGIKSRAMQKHARYMRELVCAMPDKATSCAPRWLFVGRVTADARRRAYPLR